MGRNGVRRDEMGRDGWDGFGTGWVGTRRDGMCLGRYGTGCVWDWMGRDGWEESEALPPFYGPLFIRLPNST